MHSRIHGVVGGAVFGVVAFAPAVEGDVIPISQSRTVELSASVVEMFDTASASDADGEPGLGFWSYSHNVTAPMFVLSASAAGEHASEISTAGVHASMRGSASIAGGYPSMSSARTESKSSLSYIFQLTSPAMVSLTAALNGGDAFFSAYTFVQLTGPSGELAGTGTGTYGDHPNDTEGAIDFSAMLPAGVYTLTAEMRAHLEGTTASGVTGTMETSIDLDLTIAPAPGTAAVLATIAVVPLRRRRR